MDSQIKIVVKHGDVLTIRSDVLALKYADDLYGVDRAVVHALSEHLPDITDHLPKPSDFYVASTGGAIAASNVLFVGVGPLFYFGYAQIRAFARKALEALAQEAPHAVHVTLTIHGPGYGLDETESFESEIAGLLDAINGGDFPAALRQLTIVETNAGRARRLATLLDALLPNGPGGSPACTPRPLTNIPDRIRSIGYDSRDKPHVFVAMPFAEEMDDVFHYGIQSAVNAAGFLCERADLSTFTGDVIDWVKRRIASASLVVADLSDANPNVYLEVGYAWGCGRPTVLVVKDTGQLRFDVQGQRCLPYRKIKDLEASLRAELENLKEAYLRSEEMPKNKEFNAWIL